MTARRGTAVRALALAALVAAALDAVVSLPGCSSAAGTAPASSSQHTSNASSRRVASNGQVNAAAQAGILSPSAPRFDWSVPTSTPVRTAPVTYGAFTVSSPTDFAAFAVDNYAPATITAPGITAATAAASIANWSSLTAAQQLQAEQSTVLVLTNLYASTPTLLGWSNSATASYTKDVFGLSWMLVSYDTTNIQLYALSQGGTAFCWEVPSPQSTTAYAASQVGPLAPCKGWLATGDVTTGATVTYSTPFPVWSNDVDVYEMYWGDDTGHLSCVATGAANGDAGAGKAPAPCNASYPSGAVSLGTTEALGYPVVDSISNTPGTAVESYVFIGSQYGTMYRIDDLQAPTVSFTKSMYCASTGVAGTACPTTNTADYAIYGGASVNADLGMVYWASHGTLYQAPAKGSGTGGAWATSDVKSLPLFTPTVGAPIFSTFIDVSQTTHFAYVAANDELYKVALPLSGTTVYSTPLYRHTTMAQSLPISATTTLAVPSVSEPLGSGLAFYDSIFLSSGYGNALSGGTVGAPVTAGVLMPTVSGGLEEYGCAASLANPFLSNVTSQSYGAATESSTVLDYEGGNVYFGYDTGGSAPAGGFVQYPLGGENPPAGWSCPAQSTLGSACGVTTACSGAPPPGQCVNDSDCSGSLPYCDIFPDSSFGTCVQCRTDTQCPQVAGSLEVCDTNNGAYACVPTARCSVSSNCTSAVDDPDYDTTLTSCNATAGTTAFGLCALCVSNTACAAFTSTPVCDMKNAAFASFGNCVECTADTDCTGNDEYENAGLTHCDQNPGSPSFDHCAACTNNTQCSSGEVCATTPSSASTTYFDTCVNCDASSQCPGPLATCNLTVGACECSAADPQCPTGSTCDTAAGTCSP